MGQKPGLHIAFELAGANQPRTPLWTGYAAGATPDQAFAALVKAGAEHTAAGTVRILVWQQAIRALSEQGMSVREIAATLHSSKSAVSRELRDLMDGVAVNQSERVALGIESAWRAAGTSTAP